MSIHLEIASMLLPLSHPLIDINIVRDTDATLRKIDVGNFMSKQIDNKKSIQILNILKIFVNENHFIIIF